MLIYYKYIDIFGLNGKIWKSFAQIVTLIFLLEKYEIICNAKNISVLNNVAGIYNVQVYLILTLSLGSIEDRVIRATVL